MVQCSDFLSILLDVRSIIYHFNKMGAILNQIIIGFFFTFLAFSTTYGQGYALTKQREASINEVGKVSNLVWAQYYNNELYVLTQQKEVLQYDHTGNLLAKYPIMWPDGSRSFTASCFEITEGNVCFINNHGVLVTDRKFQSQHIRPFDYINSVGDSVLFIPLITPNILVDAINDVIIHPAMAHYGIQPPYQEYLYDCKPCKTSGYLNLYSLSGHLKSLPREDPLFYDTCYATIGALPIVHQQKHLPHLWVMSMDADTEHGIIWCSQAATHQIYGYSIKGDSTITFGNKGAHLEKGDTLRSIPGTEYETNDKKYGGYMKPLQCVTPMYEQLKYDKQSGYIYRVYSRPLNEMPPANEETEKPYQTYARIDYMLSTKPRFLQVYNEQHTLVLDVAVPSYFNMLSVNKNQLVALIANDNSQIPKMAYYSFGG